MFQKHVHGLAIKLLMAFMVTIGLVASTGVLFADPASAVEIRYKYYDNWFKNGHTCKARGDQLVKTQPDWISFRCYQDDGDKKWSMDAYVDDGMGCIAAARETEAVSPMCGG